MTKKSTGIMFASQVCARYVLRDRPQPTDTSHHRQASNYFHRPPVNLARRSPEEIAASAAFAREAYEPSPLADTPGALIEPPAPEPTPAPPPVVFVEPEPEPEPEPRIEIAPEVMCSWGSWSRSELYEQAKELNIRGRSSMTKRMLLKALVAYVRGE